MLNALSTETCQMMHKIHGNKSGVSHFSRTSRASNLNEAAVELNKTKICLKYFQKGLLGQQIYE